MGVVQVHRTFLTALGMSCPCVHRTFLSAELIHNYSSKNFGSQYKYLQPSLSLIKPAFTGLFKTY